MAQSHNMSCRIHSCLPYHDYFREGNCLGHNESGKTRNFMNKTYGSDIVVFSLVVLLGDGFLKQKHTKCPKYLGHNYEMCV